MQLSLKQYLFLMLHKRGFDEILFVDGSGSSRFARTLRGEVDADWELRLRKRGGLFADRSAERYDRDCREWLNAVFTDTSRTGKTAVIMELDAFCSLYRNRPEQLRPLIECAGDSNRRSILILRSSLNAAESMEQLFGEASVFAWRDENDRCLCPGAALVRSGRTPEAYGALRANLRDRCITLNSPFLPMKDAKKEIKEGLETLLQCAMIRHGDLSHSANECAQMLNLLYCVLHSRSLQKQLELGAVRTYAQLYDSLASEGAWTRLWTMLRSTLYADPETGTTEPVFSIPAVREQECDFIEIPGGLVWESGRTNTLRSAEIPTWYLHRTGVTQYYEARSKLARVQNRIMTPWVRDLPPQLLESVDRFLQYYRDAASEDETRIPEYLESVLECMDVVSELCIRTVDEADADRICESCVDLLRTAQRYAPLQRKVYNENDAYNNLHAKKPETLSVAEKSRLLQIEEDRAQAEHFYQMLDLQRQEVSRLITQVKSGTKLSQPEPEPEPTPAVITKQKTPELTAEQAYDLIRKRANAALDREPIRH